MKLPLCEWKIINDGYGDIGWGWECSECGAFDSFCTPNIGERYLCDKCGQEHLSNFEED